MHFAAAIGDALKIRYFSVDSDRIGRKAGIDGPAAGSKVLTQTAPTDARDDGRGGDPIADGAAQTSSSDQHGVASRFLSRVEHIKTARSRLPEDRFAS
jgi:hypothetical protein